MHYKVWDAPAIEGFRSGALSRQQRAFIEGLLRMLDPRAYQSEHVSTANSALLALVRVHHALEGNVSTERQPETRLLKRLAAPARANMDAASLVSGTAPVCSRSRSKTGGIGDDASAGTVFHSDRGPS